MTENAPPDRLLTEAELEVMTALWEAGEGGVREVLGAIPRELAYTTVSTTLRILEGKGFVTSRKDGRSHIYTPCEAKPRYEARSVRHLVRALFGGDRVALLRHLVQEPVAAEERARLLALLEGDEG